MAEFCYDALSARREGGVVDADFMARQWLVTTRDLQGIGAGQALTKRGVAEPHEPIARID